MATPKGPSRKASSRRGSTRNGSTREGAPRRGAARASIADARADALPDALIDTAFELIAARGWHRLAFDEIAAEANVALVDVYRAFPTRAALLAAFTDRVDRRAIEGYQATPDDPHRDRLFDLIMRRFDAMAPHKPALRCLMRELPADPAAGLCAGGRLLRSMAWTLEAAGISTAGLYGKARLDGLVAIYLATIRVWLGDDSADLAHTMAFLDRRLQQAEQVEHWLARGCAWLRNAARSRAEV